MASYSKILDFGIGTDVGLSIQVKALNKLLPDHMPRMVECFWKITDAMAQGNSLYILTEEAMPILQTGFNADNAQTRKYAEDARENLLRLGRFDFLEIE